MSDTIRLSAAERRALLVKACAGAGLDWGTAERWAEACLCDPHAIATLAEALADVPTPFLRHAPAWQEAGLEPQVEGPAFLWNALRAAAHPPSAVALPAATFTQLKLLAERTLVPSGLDDVSNAGAGLTDND